MGRAKVGAGGLQNVMCEGWDTVRCNVRLRAERRGRQSGSSENCYESTSSVPGRRFVAWLRRFKQEGTAGLL